MIIFPEDGLLYHGSYKEVRDIDLSKCRKGLDFGQGFYLTSSYGQANSFIPKSIEKAKKQRIIDEKYSEQEGKVSVFKFRKKQGLLILVFDEANIEWLHLVACYRNESLFPDLRKKYEDVDVIIGRIANDRTAITLNNYVSGTFGDPGDEKTDRMVIDLLEPNNLTDQFCFRTRKAIDALSFIRSEAYVFRK